MTETIRVSDISKFVGQVARVTGGKADSHVTKALKERREKEIGSN
jgi:hypothetical protein